MGPRRKSGRVDSEIKVRVMSHFLRKTRAIVKNPDMLRPYLIWLAARVRGATPRHEISPGVRIGEWISFSEYYTYTTYSGIMPGEKTFARQALVRHGAQGVAFDVGANIGIFSCYLASVGSVSVHSFEAIPETFCRLRMNVVANGSSERCVLNCSAVGRDCEIVRFKYDPRSPGTNRLVSPRSGGGNTAGVSSQQVPCVSLDSYCEQLGIDRIDFLKIDVEGMEPLVLDGATKLLRSKVVHSILIEICPANLAEAGFSTTELYQKIQGLGYRPFSLAQDGTVDEPMSCPELTAITSGNVILLPA